MLLNSVKHRDKYKVSVIWRRYI